MDAKRPAFVIMLLFVSLKISITHAKGARQAALPLSPEMRSWCKPIEIHQSIRERGCEAKVVQNKACVGQCFSYYSPGTHPRKDLSDKRMKYCDMCKPSLKSWTTVSLNCPGAKFPHVDKLVEIIYDCTCQKCTKDAKHGS